MLCSINIRNPVDIKSGGSNIFFAFVGFFDALSRITITEPAIKIPINNPMIAAILLTFSTSEILQPNYIELES
ncbi:hypothetical protein GCM10007968_27840 [Sporolactobacillus putidus]|uniref:Uncharacterized protein n=1 Tax=Sporolactobacillus putidus TaxID=492735 RepID=A0A917S908_9BACL|nr:hypothetical protein GCM10007968_27840 [Sporolactobacillus putidus]